MSDDDKLVRGRCLQLFVLNIVDIIVTLKGTAYLTTSAEVNPLMAAAISVSPLFFAAVKLLIGSLLFWLLYKIRPGKVRRYGSAICLGVYWAVVVQNCLVIFLI